LRYLKGELDAFAHAVGASLRKQIVLVLDRAGTARCACGYRITSILTVDGGFVILTFISDPPYRRRVGRMLNKGEAVHSLARDLAYGQSGVLADHDYAFQVNRATCLSLLINVIVVWNTRYMQAALDHLRQAGYPVRDEDLSHLSPILSGHINLHGSHHFDFQAPKKRQGQLRPLRIAATLF
jgi:hypothetical protein